MLIWHKLKNQGTTPCANTHGHACRTGGRTQDWVNAAVQRPTTATTQQLIILTHTTHNASSGSANSNA